MLHRTIGLTLALALCVSLSACKPVPSSASSLPSPSESPAAPSPATQGPATPQPSPVWVNRTDTKAYQADDGTVILKATYALPEMPNPTTAGIAINAYYEQQKKELQSYLEGDLHDAALSDYQSAADKSQFVPYEDYQQCTVSFQNASVICFRRDYYSFSGGSHGNTAVSADLFRLDSGRRLTIADFFNVDAQTYQKRFLNLILAAAPSRANQLFEGYQTAIPEVFDPDHFYLSEHGFVFYFQPYEIGPYASGIIEFTVSYDSVKDIMVPWS